MVDFEREQIGRFLCFLGRRQNISLNYIMINVKTPEANVFVLIIFTCVLDINEYESPWWRTQIYDSHILDVEREKLDSLSLGKTSGTG